MPRKSQTVLNSELESIINEAFLVREMTTHAGWEVIKKLASFNIKTATRAWAYLNEDSKEYRELKLNTLAMYKLLDIVEDFGSNCKKAQDLWAKLNLPDEVIALDVDNLTPLQEE